MPRVFFGVLRPGDAGAEDHLHFSTVKIHRSSDDHCVFSALTLIHGEGQGRLTDTIAGAGPGCRGLQGIKVLLLVLKLVGVVCASRMKLVTNSP